MRTPAAALALASLVVLANCGDDDDAPIEPADSGADAGASDARPDGAVPDGSSGPTTVGCDDCTTFVGGRVFDGTETRDLTVVVEGSTIRDVVEGEVRVEAGDTVDLAGKTLLPGLHDLHVHLFADATPYAYQAREDHLHDHLRAFLRAGVTTVLDVGSPQDAVFELRARLRAGQLLGPSVLAAGPLVTATGGHPCRDGAPPGQFCILVDEASDVDALMERLLPDDPDVVKVVLEAGFTASPLPRLRFDLLEDLRTAADSASVPTVAHVSRTEDVTAALDAGIRFFVHVPFEDPLTPEICARAAREGAVFVPTLVVIDNLVRLSEGRLTELDDPSILDDVPQEVVDSLANRAFRPTLDPDFVAGFEVAEEGLRICMEAGVDIAAGTDCGNPGTFHGYGLRAELAHYVSAGMTPDAALATATRVAADALGLSDRGRIAPGARADLVVVEGDASEDITRLERVSAVWLAGEALDVESLALPRATPLERMPAPSPEAGETCLAGDACAEGHDCLSFPSSSCVAACSADDCPAGAGCVDLGEGPHCYASDDCDLVAQDCPNGSSCLFVGSGVKMCLFAGRAAVGESCGFGSAFCVRGTQCDGFVCRLHCRPGEADGCPMGEVCEDRSAMAGLPAGLCVPG
ncbi:MAG: amidohydrolase family protein [Deltaproteobacteria bacterium]|nr:amidohydrolase family protein [Deltaproteobacteria bacterium]